MAENQIKIEIIGESPNYCAMRQKEGRKFAKKNYERKKTEIKDVVRYLRIRYKKVSPLKDTDDFEDA